MEREVGGNTEGIRASVLREIEALYEQEAPVGEFWPQFLMDAAARFTAMLNRELSFYLTRSGEIIDISIGDRATAPLKDIRMRRNRTRLSGVRCLHTHPNGDSTLSAVDINSLKKLRFDAMAALGVREDGTPRAVSAALLGEHMTGGDNRIELLGPVNAGKLPQDEWMEAILRADDIVRILPSEITDDRPERVILVGLADSADAPEMLELRRLCETAGGEVLACVTQKRSRVDPATYIGAGKAEELALIVQGSDAELVIFDDELSGAQLRNLEELLGSRVIDRTALILDIFAQRASSREGQLQVELAQLYYQLPRLQGLGNILSRLGGGIGTRGPGETQLETDRRHIRRRISDITQELSVVAKQREVRRARREKNDIPVVALVGYTNAGKSTLLNQISGAGVLAEDKLFATLDPVTRKIELPSGQETLIVDTVGFISKLPHDLVRAFGSTLEEAMHADLLLIIHDMQSPDVLNQKKVVDQVLVELKAADKPRIEVLNKIDAAHEDAPAISGGHPISAQNGEGVEALLDVVAQALSHLSRTMEIEVPFSAGHMVSFFHEKGKVISMEYTESGTLIKVTLPLADAEHALKLLGKANA